MRYHPFPLLVFLVFIIAWVPDGWTLDVPELKGRINDYAQLLDDHQRAQLEYVLQRYEAQTTNQVVLLTVPTLQGQDIEGFSMRVAEAWRIGQKGKDNGVILLVAPKERQVRIEVGYGLEGTLTDAESSQIIRHLVVPAFRRGDYFGGISGGLQAIIKATEGEFQAPKAASPPMASHALLLLLLFIILAFSRTGRFMLLGGMLGRGMFGGRMGGGGFGGGLGGFGGGGGGFGGGGASGRW